jgi:hypothetical protein
MGIWYVDAGGAQLDLLPDGVFSLSVDAFGLEYLADSHLPRWHFIGGSMRIGAGMSNALISRSRLERIVALAICLWLGLGPIAATVPAGEKEHDCCCNSAGACLLGGCDCGSQQSRDSSPCGGLRSSRDTNGEGTTLSFVRDLGVGTLDPTGVIVELAGHSLSGVMFSPEISPSAPEPPPPRSASAC